jgi:hypothetical protein
VTPAPAPAPAKVHGSRGRLSLGAVLTGAVVVTLLRPVSWALGLAGFLAGGGVILVAWPILVLPTPTGLQNALGGPVSSLVFGDPSTALVALIVGGIAGAVVLVVTGTAAGAWAERQGIFVVLEAAADDGLGVAPADPDGAPGTARVAVIRLLALVPVLVAAALAWRPLYDAAYQELVLPQDLVTPLPIRVLGHVPWLVGAVAAVWLLADAAGAVGVRSLVLDRQPVLRAWVLGWAGLVRRPLRVIPVALTGIAILALLLVPAMVAAAIGWERVREILAEGRGPLIVLVGVAVWVGTWLGGLVLAGVGAAIRAAAWTLEAAREAEPPPSPG